MKEIPGVNLAEELKAVDQESIEEQRKKLRVKIAHIRGQHSEAKGSVARLEKDLEKAKASLAKHEGRLKKIESGDWTVLEDDKQEKPAPAQQSQE